MYLAFPFAYRWLSLNDPQNFNMLTGRGDVKIHNHWLQTRQYAAAFMYSFSYIIWQQLAAEFGGCSQLILTYPLNHRTDLPKKHITFHT